MFFVDLILPTGGLISFTFLSNDYSGTCATLAMASMVSKMPSLEPGLLPSIMTLYVGIIAFLIFHLTELTY